MPRCFELGIDSRSCGRGRIGGTRGGSSSGTTGRCGSCRGLVLGCGCGAVVIERLPLLLLLLRLRALRSGPVERLLLWSRRSQRSSDCSTLRSGDGFGRQRGCGGFVERIHAVVRCGLAFGPIGRARLGGCGVGDPGRVRVTVGPVEGVDDIIAVEHRGGDGGGRSGQAPRRPKRLSTRPSSPAPGAAWG